MIPCLLPSLAGTCLGVAALPGARTRGDSRGWRRGWAAAILGVVGLVGWTWALEWFHASTTEMLERRLLVVMQRLADPSIARKERESLLWLAPDEPPDPEALDRFATELRSRYGALRWLSITSMTQEGTFLEPIIASSVTLQFERSERLGSVRFRLVPADPVEPALLEATVMDSQAGNVTLGSSPPAGGPR